MKNLKDPGTSDEDADENADNPRGHHQNVEMSDLGRSPDYRLQESGRALRDGDSSNREDFSERFGSVHMNETAL